jgi:membrane-associated phospholipid phosphatase
MSLTTRSTRPHSLVTSRAPVSLLSARGSLHFVVALTIPVLSACADRANDPTSPLTLSTSSAIAARAAFPTALASVAWQEQARLLVAPRRVSPTDAARIYALLGVAQYGAVVDADKAVPADGLVDDGSGFGEGGRSRFEARRGAVAGASAQILSYLFPAVVLPPAGAFPGASFPAAAAALELRLSADGTAGPGAVHPQFTRGVAIGRVWGNRMIAWATDDGYSRPVCTTAPQSDMCWPGSYLAAATGVWVSNVGAAPAGPQLGAMKPYFLTSTDQFHPPPPPAVTSAAYATDLAEVTSYSRTDDSRTAFQLAEAVSLNLNVGTITPLGRWDEMAANFIVELGFDERSAAHVFALTNAAAMDAVIGCWEAKFTYYYWRPWAANAAITSLPLGRPNHSSYPYGHSCVSAAAAGVLKSFFPEPAHVAALEELVVRNGNSRIYAGIHYRFDVTAGQALGRSVAEAALAYDRRDGLLAAVR